MNDNSLIYHVSRSGIRLACFKIKSACEAASPIVRELKSENAGVNLLRVPTYTDPFGFSAKTFY